ncbi:MAG: hypothetical protein KBT21_01405 [Treponema sp.]|nr:hypothetical protein [Candidatus Treponema merdequi]
MNIKDIQEQIQFYSDKTEEIFINLAEKFPLLLNKEEGSSMDSLLGMFHSLKEQNTTVDANEEKFFSYYDKKYTPLFDALNEKIVDLSNVNADVKKIKDNSEEMELIALNAMVISIKSGEKGRAFSSITESLKQLSTDMNIYANKLLEEEQQLLHEIKELRNIFNGIMDSQKSLSTSGSTSSSSVYSLISMASDPLTDIKQIISSAYPSIQSAMEGLQLQDIIRQALNHILLCLKECSVIGSTQEITEETLDNITFNIHLLKLSISVLDDICKNINKSSEIFQTNWVKVSDTLKNVEPKRLEYISRFLDRQKVSKDNIYANMSKINDNFSDILTQFGIYQASQKTLERNCNAITEKAHQMYVVFEVLKPIIDRLHHVRILQQIEVAKNPAISAVKDSVTDMDNLINNANDSLDEMQEMLITFINQIGSLLDQFTTAIRKDSEEMNKIRIAKNSFFNEFRSVQDGLLSILSTFSVFPAGFEQICISVQNRLNELNDVYNSLRQIKAQMGEECVRLESKKSLFMQQLSVTSWDLQDDRLKDLVKQFTIAAHKEEAGQLGSFEVENSVESGEITFF